MRRVVALGMLIAAGGLGVMAQQQQAAPDAKLLAVDKVRDNLFVLKNAASGGNTAVFITGGGVVVVDTKNPGWGKPVLEKIKEITPKPVSMIINTHTHGDHVSGQVEFPATVDVVVQENTKANMQKMDIFKENAGRGMAKRTFKDRMTLGSGADQIDLYYFGPGHTNGDAIVVFRALRTAHLGDLFARKGVPLVDGANGGSLLHYFETVNKVYAGVQNVDTVITGHSDTTMTWPDVKDFANFTEDFMHSAEAALKAGKTPEQAAAEWKLPDKYKEKGFTGEVSPTLGGLPGRYKVLAEEIKK